jgi:transposase
MNYYSRNRCVFGRVMRLRRRCYRQGCPGGKVSSEPTPLIAWLSEVGVTFTRIGLEAGPLSQWLYAAMRQAGLAVELLETRHVRNAFKIMPVKTDRKDARGIAELMRLGWFRLVYCKSMEAQETRAMLTARKLVRKELQETESSLRGILRGFGLKVGKTTPGGVRGAYQGACCRTSKSGGHCIRAAFGAIRGHGC